MKVFGRGANFARLFWLAGLVGLASTAHAHHEPVPFSYFIKYNETFFQAHAWFVRNESNPSAVIPIDVNNDGFLDLVVPISVWPDDKPNRLMRVYLNDGHGNFKEATRQIFPNGVPQIFTAFELSYAIADFNGDGRPDLYLGNIGTEFGPLAFKGAQDTLLLSSGDYGFVDASAKLPKYPGATHGVAAGDIDGDGDIDIFTCEIGIGDVAHMSINDGNANFSLDFTRLHAADPRCTSALFADLNDDGKTDLILGFGGGADVYSQVLFNDGNGHFFETADSALKYVGWARDDVVIGIVTHDFDGDGRPDILINVAPDHYSNGSFLRLMLNTGHGFVDATDDFFLDSTRVPFAYNSRVALVDLNNDGYLDILNDWNVQRRFYINDGNGRFKKLLNDFLPVTTLDNNYNASGRLYHAAFGDFDGDGRFDYLGFNGGYRPPNCPSNICPTDYFEIFYSKDLPAQQTGTAKGSSILGGPKAETLTGLGANDVIFAAAGNDKVFGGDGNDYLNGGKGNDVINGGPGNDTLVGGPGNDTLIGGTGKDIFVFNSRLIAANVDSLPDFTPADDKIHLDKNIFKGLPKGALSPGAFVALPGTTTASTRIIYNKNTGELLFDADGTGPTIPALFARTKKGLTLTSSHFVAY